MLWNGLCHRSASSFGKDKTCLFLNAEKMHKSAIIHLKANCEKRRKHSPFLNNFSVKKVNKGIFFVNLSETVCKIEGNAMTINLSNE